MALPPELLYACGRPQCFSCDAFKLNAQVHESGTRACPRKSRAPCRRSRRSSPSPACTKQPATMLMRHLNQEGRLANH
eukprot:6190077-Pleurochrysis_carterae.AAC.1